MAVEWIKRWPWWAHAGVVVLWAFGTASFAFYFTSDLFHETCLNEVNLLTGELERSNCGDGASVGDDAVPEPSASATAPPQVATAEATGTASPAVASPTSSATDVPMASDPTPTPAVATPTATETAEPEASPSAGVLAVGTFQDGDPGHDGSGFAEVQRLPDGSLNLFLSEFSVTNGPDLFVVLTRDPGGEYSDGDLVLEVLRANNGNQNYALPADIDISQWGAVLIWCRQFDVEFAFATLGGVE
jgi:hypothetical protein